METKKLKSWEVFKKDILPKCSCYQEYAKGDISFLYEYRHWLIPFKFLNLFGREINTQKINDTDYLYGMDILLHISWFE